MHTDEAWLSPQCLLCQKKPKTAGSSAFALEMMKRDLRLSLIEQTGERIEHQHDDISDKQEQRRMDQLPKQHAQRVVRSIIIDHGRAEEIDERRQHQKAADDGTQPEDDLSADAQGVGQLLPAFFDSRRLCATTLSRFRSF